MAMQTAALTAPEITAPPAPWTFKPYISPPGIARIFDARSDRIGECSVDAAAVIVRAVNAHAALIAIAREISILGPGKCSLGKQFVENARAALELAGA